MSGAPSGQYFDVTMDGESRRYYIAPRVLSDKTLDRLRAVLIKRRREKRMELMKDFASVAGSLPQATQESFGKQLLADAKADVQIGTEEIIDFMQSGDREALGTLLMCVTNEIDSYEHALKVMDAYGNVDELFQLVLGVASEEHEATGN